MDILIDLATMAVMLPSGVPLTDLSLVRGDKLPLRVSLLDDGTPVTPSGTRPALAVKTALGDDTLVLAATNLEPVDDALGAAYVGSLSVNTTQLVAAMGSAESIDLVGELVLMAGDGSQRTSSLIRVAVRQDIMPADVVLRRTSSPTGRRWWPHPWPPSCRMYWTALCKSAACTWTPLPDRPPLPPERPRLPRSWPATQWSGETSCWPAT